MSSGATLRYTKPTSKPNAIEPERPRPACASARQARPPRTRRAEPAGENGSRAARRAARGTRGSARTARPGTSWRARRRAEQAREQLELAAARRLSPSARSPRPPRADRGARRPPARPRRASPRAASSVALHRLAERAPRRAVGARRVEQRIELRRVLVGTAGAARSLPCAGVSGTRAARARTRPRSAGPTRAASARVRGLCRRTSARARARGASPACARASGRKRAGSARARAISSPSPPGPRRGRRGTIGLSRRHRSHLLSVREVEPPRTTRRRRRGLEALDDPCPSSRSASGGVVGASSSARAASSAASIGERVPRGSAPRARPRSPCRPAVHLRLCARCSARVSAALRAAGAPPDPSSPFRTPPSYPPTPRTRRVGGWNCCELASSAIMLVRPIAPRPASPTTSADAPSRRARRRALAATRSGAHSKTSGQPDSHEGLAFALSLVFFDTPCLRRSGPAGSVPRGLCGPRRR